ncbi:MAG: selenocysteine lyase, partial [Calditrichaeota bacterium]|nr:selenocysteine lyase [Calditrichota bacterium]
VRLLNDCFGIQTRGGCSCAGTYGHVLLRINSRKSKEITDMIDHGDLSQKPGWVRISLHPTMTETEVDFIADALAEVVRDHEKMAADYQFDKHSGDFRSPKYSEAMIDLKAGFRTQEV